MTYYDNTLYRFLVDGVVVWMTNLAAEELQEENSLIDVQFAGDECTCHDGDGYALCPSCQAYQDRKQNEEIPYE